MLSMYEELLSMIVTGTSGIFFYVCQSLLLDALREKILFNLIILKFYNFNY